MGDLTQEQIDAMLRGEDIHADEAVSGTAQNSVDAIQAAAQEEAAAVPEEAAPQTENNDPQQAVATSQEPMEEITEDINEFLSPDEVDTIGEIGNICMGTAATTMSTILGRRVIITTPTVKMFKPENALAAYRCPFLAVSVSYTDGIEGKNLLILKDVDAAIITDVMMGGDGHVDKDNIALSELHFSAISEIMNQMIGSSATALSNMLGKSVNITPPYAETVDIGADVSGLMDDTQMLVRISFDMEIEGILNSKLLQMMPLELAKYLAQSQLNPPTPAPAAPAPAAPAPAAAPTPAPAPAASYAAAPVAAPSFASAPAPAPARPQPMVSVRPADCQDFDGDANAAAGDVGNLRLINDIPLQVTVELGRTHKSLQEVMNFGVGSIVVLDRLAGEPVDVIVNGKRIAKGEVVVIDENYGVRINEIFNGIT